MPWGFGVASGVRWRGGWREKILKVFSIGSESCVIIEGFADRSERSAEDGDES